MIEEQFLHLISNRTRVPVAKVTKAIELFRDGATIPFVARYRKDVTGNLDEVHLESIFELNEQFTEFSKRRAYILATIEKQEQLTPELKELILACTDPVALEDLYLPFKKAKRTKATVAREKGLLPLADYLWEQTPGDSPLQDFAAKFVRADKAVASLDEAFDGAKHIIAERVSVNLDARAMVRDRMEKYGVIVAHPTKNCEGKQTKFEAYYAFSEPVAKIPSHRYLAVHRGVKDGFLRMELGLDDARMLSELNEKFVKSPENECTPHVVSAIEDSYNRLLRPSIENEVLKQVQERADTEAIRVFRENAHNLLLSPPAGPISVIGIDPGLRTGCKVAVVNSTGAFVENATIFPTPPQNDTENAEKILLALIAKHNVGAIAVGNGTGSREVARFIREVLPKATPSVFMVLVNESGASIYSASKIAREEFPDLDLTVRGAISIARRLQDPLAELVKLEPRHIGVGQYQHDVNQKALREGLERTVVSCVNAVGVDLNTASAPLLRHVSGVQTDIAEKIVAFRVSRGGFRSRAELREVPGLGPKAFEQCAGFLRVRGGDQPLDATGIHPEAYPVVEKLAESLAVTVTDLLESPSRIDEVDVSALKNEVVGLFTLEDIRQELKKPGRDPRREFKVPAFLEGVDKVESLESGMEIEGIVTNVTDFGAFVDIGVHQDGLVHLSELANRYIQDPREVVKVGDVVRVKVLKVDKALPRISLSMKALLPAEPRPQPARRERPAPQSDSRQPNARPQKDAERRPDRGRERRPDSGRTDQRNRANAPRNTPQSKPKQPEKLADTPLVNTQLADQLSALRKKLGA